MNWRGVGLVPGVTFAHVLVEGSNSQVSFSSVGTAPRVLPPNTTSLLVLGFHATEWRLRAGGAPTAPCAWTCVNVPASASKAHRSLVTVLVLLPRLPPNTQIWLLLAAPHESARNVVLKFGTAGGVPAGNVVPAEVTATQVARGAARLVRVTVGSWAAAVATSSGRMTRHLP